MFINSIVQMFFMPNAEEFSELIRTGGLDFALLKPIDTQFLISLRKVDWSSLANFVRGGRADGVRAAASRRTSAHRCWQVMLYPLYVVLRRRHPVQPDDRAGGHQRLARPQQSLYDFWFYITNFSRYPMEIYHGPIGDWLRWALHVHAADAGRGQRAGPHAGQAAAAGVLRTWPCSPSWRPPPASSPAAGCFSGRC